MAAEEAEMPKKTGKRKKRAKIFGSREGTVKWYDTTKRFGFIVPDGVGKDVFIHASELKRAGISRLNTGDRVKFDIVQGARSFEAVNIEHIVLIRESLSVVGLANRTVGALKLFYLDLGYGFIVPEGGGPDVMIHNEVVKASGLSAVDMLVGRKFEYTYETGPDRRLRANRLFTI